MLGRIQRSAADAGVQHGVVLEADLLCAGLELDVVNGGGNACGELLPALGGGPYGC